MVGFYDKYLFLSKPVRLRLNDITLNRMWWKIYVCSEAVLLTDCCRTLEGDLLSTHNLYNHLSTVETISLDMTIFTEICYKMWKSLTTMTRKKHKKRKPQASSSNLLISWVVCAPSSVTTDTTSGRNPIVNLKTKKRCSFYRNFLKDQIWFELSIMLHAPTFSMSPTLFNSCFLENATLVLLVDLYCNTLKAERRVMRRCLPHVLNCGKRGSDEHALKWRWGYTRVITHKCKWSYKMNLTVKRK